MAERTAFEDSFRVGQFKAVPGADLEERDLIKQSIEMILGNDHGFAVQIEKAKNLHEIVIEIPLVICLERDGEHYMEIDAPFGVKFRWELPHEFARECGLTMYSPGTTSMLVQQSGRGQVREGSGDPDETWYEEMTLFAKPTLVKSKAMQ